MAASANTAIGKWGNSAGVRIPKDIAEQANLREGDRVHLSVEAPGVIVIRTVTEKLSLGSLVSRITPKNRHKETQWGRPRGNETW